MGLPRIKEKSCPRPGLLKLQAWFRPDFNSLRNSDAFAYWMGTFGDDLGFAKKMGFHVCQIYPIRGWGQDRTLVG